MYKEQSVARNIIIGISILLCVLSAVIIYRAAVYPHGPGQLTDIPKGPELTDLKEESEKISEQPKQNNEVSGELIERIQATLNEQENSIMQKDANVPENSGPAAVK